MKVTYAKLQAQVLQAKAASVEQAAQMQAEVSALEHRLLASEAALAAAPARVQPPEHQHTNHQMRKLLTLNPYLCVFLQADVMQAKAASQEQAAQVKAEVSDLE